MSTVFRFTPGQRRLIVKEFRSESGIEALEAIVARYLDHCHHRMTPAEIREQLLAIRKHARQLLRAVNVLATKTDAPAEWLQSPLRECETYAVGLLKYRFSEPLKRGRRNHTAEAQLVRDTAALWTHVHGRSPGRGRGPFSRLIAKMLEYAGIQDSPLENPDELLREGLATPIRMAGPNYPFAQLAETNQLPPMKRVAEEFFSKVLWVTNGSPTVTIYQSSRTRTTGKFRRKF